ncbi:uncharacterized protein LOC125179117 [Hyalella azteca]|uniref:Uncharacterized protein LOC125179117 n=1 Tax=Hyalella azteca TaxID=294128 RepID=A0A979FSV4_HYAAZ|nr:uncharacterized protein LOC125179117 [Hyalella azteca]
MACPWVVGGLFLALYLTHATVLCDQSTFEARNAGRDQRYSGSILLSTSVFSRSACLSLCGNNPRCDGFSYAGGSCQLMSCVTGLVAAAGWISYEMTFPLRHYTPQGACVTCPCSGAKECVSYSTLAPMPYTYQAAYAALPGYICTAAQPFIDQRKQNKSCKFVSHWNVEVTDACISVASSLSETFTACSAYDCLSLLAVFGSNDVYGYLSPTLAPLVGSATTPSQNSTWIKVSWFPECA